METVFLASGVLGLEEHTLCLYPAEFANDFWCFEKFASDLWNLDPELLFLGRLAYELGSFVWRLCFLVTWI